MKDVDKLYNVPNEVTYSGLVALLNNGDERGLVGIYDLFYKRLLFFAIKYVKHQQVAEEVVGDVFVKLWERRTAFANIGRIQAFLYIAVKNRALNHLRDVKDRLYIADVENHEELLSTDIDAFTKVVQIELLDLIYNEVRKLPEKQRVVFNKTFFEDKTIDEISEELGMAPQAVYTNKSRALATLRQNLPFKDSLLLIVLISLLER